jgi:hypothetical protein
MGKFIDLGFTGPLVAFSNTPEKDGYIVTRAGHPYRIHPTDSPEDVLSAFNEDKDTLEILPYQEPVRPTFTYVEKRQGAYPSIEDQLDTLYHGGYDAWKATIKAVKDTYPKE